MYRKIDSALTTFGSACGTCERMACSCSDENNVPIYGLVVGVDNNYGIVDNILDKVSDGFIVLCAFIALSFNRVIDFVLEGFEKAFRGGRL